MSKGVKEGVIFYSLVGRFWFFFFVCFVVCNGYLFAATNGGDVPLEAIDKVVVYGEAVLAEEDQNKNIIVIDENQIKETKAKTLVELLATIPALGMTSYGTYQSSFAYVRGTPPHSTIVLVNGVKLQDSTSGTFDLSFIPISAVEKIEIIASGDSVKYGQNAAGGVINIITKKTKNENMKSEFVAELGSNNSSYLDFNLLKQSLNGKHKYGIFFSSNSSSGYSLSAFEKSNNAEKDGFNKINITAFYDYEGLETFLQYNLSNVETDPFVYDLGTHTPYLKDYGNYSDYKSIYNGYIRYKKKIMNIENSFVVSVNYTNKISEVVDPTLFVLGDYGGLNIDENKYKDSNNYRGSVIGVSYNGSGEYLKNGFFKFGVDYDYYKSKQNLESYEINSYDYLCVLNPNNCLEQMEFKEQNQESLYGAYLILGYKFLDSLNVNSGIRYGGATSYDSNEKINYSLGADYIVNQFLKLKTNYFYTFKNPNLYELNDMSFGNKNLETEIIKSFETGFDSYFFEEKEILSVTYFNTKIDNLITLDYSSRGQQFINDPNKYNINGVYFSSVTKIMDFINLNLSYSHMWFNKQMVRRPENSFIIGLFFNFNDKIHATIENIFFGKTKDGFESVGYYEMPSYNIVNVTVNYYINTNSSFYVKAINLFNEEYQPAFGFVSSGITIYAGFNYKI